MGRYRIFGLGIITGVWGSFPMEVISELVSKRKE